MSSSASVSWVFFQVVKGGRDEIASTTSHSDIRGLPGAEPHDRAPS
jgi:hypothetical protein